MKMRWGSLYVVEEGEELFSRILPLLRACLDVQLQSVKWHALDSLACTWAADVPLFCDAVIRYSTIAT